MPAFWLVEIGKLDIAMVIVNKLPMVDGFFRFPDQQCANRIFAHDGIKQARDLVLAPNERPLDIRQPEAPTLGFLIVQVGHHLADRQFLVLHSTRSLDYSKSSLCSSVGIVPAADSIPVQLVMSSL